LFKIKGEEINFFYDCNSAWPWKGRTLFSAPFIWIPTLPFLNADYIVKLSFKEHVRAEEYLEIMFLSSVIK
jgi:hypothetical protein